jgi:putative membrane protein
MCDMMGMMGVMGPLMMVVWLIIVLAVLGLGIVGTVWLVRSLTDTSGRPQISGRPDSAQEELRRQYASGAIDREEFLQRKIDLEE